MEDEAAITGVAMKAIVERLPAHDLLTVADVASAAFVNQSTVLGWIDSGRFEVLNLTAGERPYYKIPRAGLLKFLKSRVQ